jgi:hypothetical protein
MAGRVPDDYNSWDWREVLIDPVLQPTLHTRTRDAIVGKWRNIWMSNHRAELLAYGAQLIAQYSNGSGSTTSAAAAAAAAAGGSSSNSSNSCCSSSSSSVVKPVLSTRHRDVHESTDIISGMLTVNYPLHNMLC